MIKKSILSSIATMLFSTTTINAYAGAQFVYEHDKYGSSVSGSLSVLTNAISDGADVKVSAPSASGTRAFFTCDFVYVKTGLVTCMNTNHISVRGVEGSNFGFQDNAYHWFSMVNTNGKRDMSRWNVGEHVDRGHTQDQVGLRWYID